MANSVVQIALHEGTEFRAVRLELEHDGAIRMGTHDMGPGVEQSWGDDDYEFWVRVPPALLPRLAFELLHEKFVGRLDAVDAFRNWCAAHGVQHEFGQWV